MRAIPDELATHLQTGETTLCRAWRLTRRDGVVLGFTEHDEKLSFAGIRFEAGSGFEGSEADGASGLAAPAAEIAGGFSSVAIREADLAVGLYDGARVETFIVNWQAPENQHLRLSVSEIGEVSRAGGAFGAELRSLAHRLSQETGRIYNRRCDADLGDDRCRLSMAVADRRVSGEVLSVETPDQLVIGGLPVLVDGHFRLGHLRFDAGALSGQRVTIEESLARGGDTLIRLWLPLDHAPDIGTAVTLSVGCDKRFSTCRDRFANALNFQGFPHMPGSDFAYSYVGGDTTHDGRVVVG
ncbi:DUF2163 domain-containing protein [Peteryoungia desertarenae]|uniref:DUF2163 domain-containing protein n=1 Tax=Peteryoungia desertarenae TaxID=1813451 RepID=A0ABX6QMS1_9HYPH|nr:DUF2163 domain-containing protein [Peteryoungia desertarenae]QLF69874.1 DUF2163 domain-containing protein [Peteryoungia desertarenae]